MKKVRVIGGGISGLATAFYLKKRGLNITVYEKQSRVGGKLQTTPSIYGPMESAANAILADQNVEEIAREIGLPLISKKPEARRRYILKNKKPQRWPLGIVSTLRLILFALKMIFYKKSIQPQKEQSLHDWSQENFGMEATAYLVDPGCQGIFGATSKDLSATLIFNYFFNRKKNKKGLLRGSIAPQAGMGDWGVKLKSYLQSQGVQFVLESDNVPLEDFADDIIVVATDIANVALLLEQLDDPRAELVRKIPLVDLVSVNCFFRTQPIEGFGLLFPLSENKSARGVLFNASIFPDKTASDAQSSETWIFGAPAPYCESVKNDNFFIQEICQLRQEIWGHQERPLSWRVNRWERALPLYGLTLERVLAELAIERNNVFLMGNYLGDIGLNRILLRAQALADRISQVGHAADS